MTKLPRVPMTADEFLEWVQTQEEKYELVDGYPVPKFLEDWPHPPKTAGKPSRPPPIVNSRIASNLERLLNDALERHDPSRIAIQRPMVEIGPFGCVPSVAVIDNDPAPGRTTVQRAYLLAEVMDDDTREEQEDRVFLYRDHPDCEVILAIEPGWVCVHVWQRQGKGEETTYRTLESMGDYTPLPAFGATISVADLYAGTHLAPGKGDRAVLLDFSEGRISRLTAMHRLGGISYSELLDRIAEAGLTLPQVSDEEAERMANTMNAVLDGDQDGIVLATVNAPYKREIDASQLAQCLRSRDPGDWRVHVANFLTDVRPGLVIAFAERHGIGLDALADTYRDLKRATGERSHALEAALAKALAPAWQRENAEAIRQHNEMIEREGLPLWPPFWMRDDENDKET